MAKAALLNLSAAEVEQQPRPSSTKTREDARENASLLGSYTISRLRSWWRCCQEQTPILPAHRALREGTRRLQVNREGLLIECRV